MEAQRHCVKLSRRQVNVQTTTAGTLGRSSFDLLLIIGHVWQNCSVELKCCWWARKQINGWLTEAGASWWELATVGSSGQPACCLWPWVEESSSNSARLFCLFVLSLEICKKLFILVTEFDPLGLITFVKSRRPTWLNDPIQVSEVLNQKLCTWPQWQYLMFLWLWRPPGCLNVCSVFSPSQ